MPAFLDISGQPTIYTELYVTNVSRDSITLTKLKIYSSITSQVILVLNSDELRRKFSHINNASKVSALHLLPQESAILYLEVNLPKENASMPLSFHIDFRASTSPKTEQYVILKTPQILRPEVVLGAPLRAGPWTAVYDPSWERGHRRVIYNVNGKPHIPGRFAIDFIRMNISGEYADGAQDSIKNWFGYGNDVLAVADGVVESIRDDFAESPTLSGHPEYSSDKATGNYISINIGVGHFAFYEHLKPGSIKVKPGQKVKRGDVIGSLGFTGQTTGPHLHFHVADVNSPLDAEGIPFAFNKFNMLGSYSDLEKFGNEPWTPSEKRIVTKERPSPNSVIEF